MNKILQQINLLPEVIGSVVFNMEGEVVATELGTVTDSSKLEEICNLLTNHIEVLQQITEGVTTLDFRFTTARIIVRSLSGGFLLISCSTSVNTALLNISLNVSVRRLEKLITDFTRLPRNPPPAQVEPQKAEQPQPPPPKAKRIVALGI